MSTSGSTSVAGTFEECLDDLNDFVATLGRYPDTVLASAMRTHLASLLQALLEHGECTRQEVVEFLAELEREALQPEDG
jgi:hypothetical protein